MKKNVFLFLCAIFCAQFLLAQDYNWPLKTDLNDIKGSKNGTNFGVTFQNDATRGAVAVFDGNSYAKLPSFVNGVTAITVAIWWRMDEKRPWSRVYSFGKGDQSEPKDVMMIIPVTGAGDPVKNFYRFTLSDPTGPWLDADIDTLETNIKLNEWNYSVVVIKDDSVIFYHNDKQIFAEGGFIRKIETLDDIENALGKSFWPDQMWKGALSDLRVYKKGMTPSEVKTLYDATKAGATGTQIVKSDNNPTISAANNHIRVVLKQSDANAMVSVYGIAGNLICSKSVSELNNTYFSKGLFLVKVQADCVKYNQKIIIE